ncbi:cilia- and flagella-associated protein 57 isoform X1 [Rhineura floridana]|uniref:cilia- and flagella-associated protein 57 isoform X1 n=1 Tax=Rhineura floridana TaxID=261503 RepID=UPI002AC81A6A|nr:cilia- and flagella-associated protein 57 isoform X1 [Rhineura floridana]
MSVIVAQALHIFGFQSRVANNICFFDEQIIVYPAGNSCVKYHIEQKWQKFIPGSEKSQGMLALAISPNRRYLAISEILQDKPTITIYELSSVPCKKRKVLNTFDFSVQEFISLGFSPDSKYLVAQTGPPESNLAYWMWEKQRTMAIVKVDVQNNPLYQVSFNPQDNTQVCVTGNGIFKLFRYTEGTLKQTNFLRGEPQNYLSHAWLSEEKVIVGTDTGKLYLFESGDLRWETSIERKEIICEIVKEELQQESESLIEFPAPTSPEYSSELICETEAQQQASLPRVSAIAAYSKGFACSAGPGIVLLFEKSEEKEGYRESREIRIPQDQCSNDPNQSDKQEVVCIAFSPAEETLLISTNRNQLYLLSMSSAEMNKAETAHFEYLNYPIHSSSITGLDTCIRKPLVATCSLDKSVRIWNYENNTLDLYKEYQEEAYTLALHPGGLYVLVGFADKLRLMNLLIDDIRVFKDFTVRGCRECAFSTGGHLFAAVNGNVIHIYSATSFDNVINLKGHNGKVRSVVWSMDDYKLISCGTDGAVYEWNLQNGKRESECVLKSCSYSGVAISPDAKVIFAVGSDHSIKEICDSSILREVPTFDVAYTCIVVSHSGRMVFTGTSAGTIRSMKYPLPVHKEFNEYQAHAGPVTKMSITADDQFLLTSAEDGCIVIWKVYDKEGRGLKRERDVPYSDEVLITRTDMEEKTQIMLELKTRVEELKMENEYQLRLKDMNYNEKIKELTEKFIQEMESLKTKNQVLKAEKEKQEVQHQEQLTELMEKQSREVQDLESGNNQKLLLEYEKYQELQMKSQRMQEEYEKQLHEMEENKSQALEELTEYYEAKLLEKTTMLEEAQDEARMQLREFEETKKQIEEDEDREIQEIKIKYERRLREERESNLRLKGETGIMRKKFNSLQKEIEERCSDIEAMKLEQQKLQGIIKALEKDIQGLKREIQERDETIQDKEKRIYDLKKKNQELEKFKFVLDYKIKELKKQIEPRENDIKAMKEQIQEMEGELERFHKQNTQLELNIAELRLKLKATDREMHKEMQKERDMEALVKRFKTDLHNCVGLIQEPKKLKEGIRDIYEKYVQKADMVEIVGVDTDLHQEYTRQREHLERNLATLKKKVIKEGEIHRADYVRIMQENVSLIKEINELRRELKVTRTQIHDLQSTLGLLTKRKKQPAQSMVTIKQCDFPFPPGPSPDRQQSPGILRLNPEEETERIVEMQRLEIKHLRDQMQGQEKALALRPTSGSKLPILELDRSSGEQLQ